MNYYLIRARGGNEDIINYLKKSSVVGMGWSECEFDNCKNADEFVKNIENKYNIELTGQRSGIAKRFFNIQNGDRVIIPCYKHIILAEVSGEKIYDASDEAKNFDIQNQIKVRFLLDDNQKLLRIPRENLEESFQRRLKARQTVLSMDQFGDDINKIFQDKEGYSATSKISNIETENYIKIKNSLKYQIQNNSYLKTGGEGLEELVVKLFEIDGYSAERLSKKSGNDEADADVVAEKKSLLGDLIGVGYYIQVKHHKGNTGSWGLEQISKFKEQMKYKGNTNYEYILLTTGDVNVGLIKKCEEKNIILIDGNMFTEMIINVIDKLPSKFRHAIGIAKNYEIVK